MSSQGLPQNLCYALRDHYSCGHIIPRISEVAKLQRVPTCPKCIFRQEIGIPWGCIEYQLVERHHNLNCPECSLLDESESVVDTANTLQEIEQSPREMGDTIVVGPPSQTNNNPETNDQESEDVKQPANNHPVITHGITRAERRRIHDVNQRTAEDVEMLMQQVRRYEEQIEASVLDDQMHNNGRQSKKTLGELAKLRSFKKYWSLD